jgi:hypothetical protein
LSFRFSREEKQEFRRAEHPRGARRRPGYTAAIVVVPKMVTRYESRTGSRPFHP